MKSKGSSDVTSWIRRLSCGTSFALVASMVLLGVACGGKADVVPVDPQPPEAAVAGVDAAPTAVVPTPAPVFAAPEPAAVAEPAQEPEPVVVARTDCAAIRGSAYESPEERDWFLANCRAPAQSARAPAPVAPAAPAAAANPAPAPASAASEEEQRYRSKASAQLGYFTARLRQFWRSEYSPGFAAELLELASVSDGFVNALDGLQPVPPRFKSAHDAMRRAEAAFRDYVRTGITLKTVGEFIRWYPGLDAAADRADGALYTYNQVVGTNIPGLK